MGASASSSKLILALAILNVVAVLIVGSAHLGRPPGFWDDRRTIVVAASIASAAFPFIQAAAAERGEKSRRRKLEREKRIQACLSASLLYAARHAWTDWENTGIQAFEVRGPRWAPRQARVARIRLAPIPSSGVKWTKGKGVIGRCWSERNEQYVDLGNHFASYSRLDRAGWDALPADTRYGLTFDDFQALKGKYGTVAAVPIVNEADQYIGCVTADMPPATDGIRHPLRDELMKSLATTAGLVAQVLAD